MYGRHPLLPIDIQFGIFTPDICETATHKYVQKLRSRLDYAYKKARQVSAKEAERAKQQYDLKIKCSKLEIDLVLGQKKSFHWETKFQITGKMTYIYMVVLTRQDGVPVITVKKLQGGMERKLH